MLYMRSVRQVLPLQINGVEGDPRRQQIRDPSPFEWQAPARVHQARASSIAIGRGRLTWRGNAALRSCAS